MNLQPHQQRVVDELATLDEKITKLSAFVNGDVYKYLPAAEKRLLVQQLYHMRHYALTLEERVALWN